MHINIIYASICYTGRITNDILVNLTETINKTTNIEKTIPSIQENITYIEYYISNLNNLYVENINKTNENIQNLEFLNTSVTLFENNFENKILNLKNELYNSSTIYTLDTNISINNLKNEISLNKNLSSEYNDQFIAYKNSSEFFMDILHNNISSLDIYLKDINKNTILDHEYIDIMYVSLESLNKSVLTNHDNLNTSIIELKNNMYDNNTNILNTIDVLNKSISENFSHFWSMTEMLTDTEVYMYECICVFVYICTIVYICICTYMYVCMDISVYVYV
jgi:hypothetical protein